jgi:hypothetical protein
MLNYVDVDTTTEWFMKALATRAINYFLDGEIGGVGAFAVEECSRYPNFVGDFELGKNFFFHEYLTAM